MQATDMGAMTALIEGMSLPPEAKTCPDFHKQGWYLRECQSHGRRAAKALDEWHHRNQQPSSFRGPPPDPASVKRLAKKIERREQEYESKRCDLEAFAADVQRERDAHILKELTELEARRAAEFEAEEKEARAKFDAEEQAAIARFEAEEKERVAAFKHEGKTRRDAYEQKLQKFRLSWEEGERVYRDTSARNTPPVRATSGNLPSKKRSRSPATNAPMKRPRSPG
jgi:hypothetical protein